jgi:hypothetical protein
MHAIFMVKPVLSSKANAGREGNHIGGTTYNHWCRFSRNTGSSACCQGLGPIAECSFNSCHFELPVVSLPQSERTEGSNPTRLTNRSEFEYLYTLCIFNLEDTCLNLSNPH